MTTESTPSLSVIERWIYEEDGTQLWDAVSHGWQWRYDDGTPRGPAHATRAAADRWAWREWGHMLPHRRRA